MSDYNSISEFAPSNFTGSLSLGLIKTVANNPANTGAHVVNFPSYYDEFINKTEGQASAPVPVVAEKYGTNEIVYQGTDAYLYLHHLPMELAGGSIQLSEGTINTGATDYTLGLLKFVTIPTGNFYVNYLARADAFASEHVNALQNAVMAIQRMVGAGSLTGEGLRNAEYWVDEWPTSLQAILPDAVYTKAIEKDVQLKGKASESHTITLGNGADEIVFDTKKIDITSTDASQAISGTFGDAEDDIFIFRSPVHFEATGNTGITQLDTGLHGGAAFAVGNPLQSAWTGSGPGPYSMPYPDTGRYPIARIYGDLQVIGDVFLSGTITATSTDAGEQVSHIAEILSVGTDLRVTGDSYLGTDTSTKTIMGGYLDVGRYVHVKGLANDISRINTAIYLQNQGNTNNGLGGPFADNVVSRGTKWLSELPYHFSNVDYATPGTINDLTVNKVSHVDGLDPSYLAKLMVFRAHNRADFKNNTVNIGPFDGFTGHVSTGAGPLTSQWIDTGMSWPTGSSLSGFSTTYGFSGAIESVGQHPFRWYHMGGDYYHGKFTNETVNIPSGEFSGNYPYGNGNQWIALWTNNDLLTAGINPGAKKFGARVPLSKITVDYHTGSPYVASGVTVVLSRPFNTAINTGDAYQLYHPRNTIGNAIRWIDASNIQVYASQAEPIIATVDGVTKILTAPCNESVVSSYTGFVYLAVDNKTPEIAKSYGGHLNESEPTIELLTSPSPNDSQVLLGEFYQSQPDAGGGYPAGIDKTSIVTYRYNTEYDTLWMRAQSTGNLYSGNANTYEFGYRSNPAPDATTIGQHTGGDVNMAAIQAPSTHAIGSNFGDILAVNNDEYRVRIQHNFGSRERAENADLRVFAAPNLSDQYLGHGTGAVGWPSLSGGLREGPDYAYVHRIQDGINPDDLVNPYRGQGCYRVLHTDRNYTDITIYEMDKIAGSIITARSNNGYRILSLTGVAGNDRDPAPFTGAAHGGIEERERRWWWLRVTMG